MFKNWSVYIRCEFCLPAGEFIVCHCLLSFLSCYIFLSGTLKKEWESGFKFFCLFPLYYKGCSTLEEALSNDGKSDWFCRCQHTPWCLPEWRFVKKDVKLEHNHVNSILLRFIVCICPQTWQEMVYGGVNWKENLQNAEIQLLISFCMTTKQLMRNFSN